MSERDLPIMPFFVKDWIAATMHWPGAERGAYISLLAFQWVNGLVPPDVSQLARITGFSETEFERLWVTVGPKFDCNARGLFNNRLEDHRKEAQRLRAARALGATLANEKRRAGRVTQQGSTTVPPDDAERTHTSTSTSTSTSSEEKKLSARPARAQRVSRETPDDFYDEGFLRFKLAMPTRVGGQPIRRATMGWRARKSEGVDPELMIAGAERYARYAEAMIPDKQYVMQMATFIGPDKHYLADWEVPADGAQSERWTPPTDETLDPP